MGKKSMKAAAKVLSKSGLAEEIATATELKKKNVVSVLDSLASVATTQVKKVGKVTIPGLFMIKTRVKPATKAGKREVFGKVVFVKAKPAKTVVKGYCVAALKKSVWVRPLRLPRRDVRAQVRELLLSKALLLAVARAALVLRRRPCQELVLGLGVIGLPCCA